LYKVDAQGAASEFGTLHAIAPEHFVVRGGPARIEGLTQGIPYFLQDARGPPVFWAVPFRRRIPSLPCLHACKTGAMTML
jgi:hypothetical protein